MLAALRERATPLTIGVALATLGCLVLALLNIGDKSLWLDEGISAHYSSGSWADMGRVFTDVEPNNLFYYSLLKVASGVVGASEAALRLPSAVFAVATVPVVAAIAARVFGTRTALIAALLLATSAFLIAYAQEARQYALALLLSSASVLLFMRALDLTASWTRWGAWVVVSAAAVYAHLFAGFVVAAQAVTLGFHPRRPRTRTLIAAALALAAAVAPLAIAMEPGRFTWIPPTSWNGFRTAVEDLAGGPVLVWGLLAAAAAGLGGSVRDRRRSGAPGPQPWQLVLVSSWLLLPFALAVLVSIWQPAFVTRYLIVALPGLMVLAAAGLARLRPWPVLAATLVALSVLGVERISDHYESPKENWRSAAGIVAGRATPGDAIVIFRHGEPVFDYYYSPEPVAAEAPVIPLATAEPADFTRGNRIWLVLFREYVDPGLFGLLQGAVARDRQMIETQQLNAIRIELWAPA